MLLEIRPHSSTSSKHPLLISRTHHGKTGLSAIQLYNKDLEDDAPIATYDYPIERGSATKIHLTQPQIAESLELLEKIIPSFLILETRMRIHEKEDYVGQGRKVFVSNEAGILLGIRPR